LLKKITRHSEQGPYGAWREIRFAVFDSQALEAVAKLMKIYESAGRNLFV
jgi:hypothetical protein